MSPRYALTFAGLAAVCGGQAWALLAWHGSIPSVMLGATAFSMGLVAVAYAGAGPCVLLKRRDGCIAWAGLLVHAPFLSVKHAAFTLVRLLSQEPPWVVVNASLMFGRRLTVAEAALLPCVAVLDLAAEFSEVAPLRASSLYRSLPVLDATAPSLRDLRDAVNWIHDVTRDGPVYIHCALGHGRSACVVIAVLLMKGEVTTVEEGVQRLRRLRAGVGLNAHQRARLQSLVSASDQFPTAAIRE